VLLFTALAGEELLVKYDRNNAKPRNTAPNVESANIGGSSGAGRAHGGDDVDADADDAAAADDDDADDDDADVDGGRAQKGAGATFAAPSSVAVSSEASADSSSDDGVRVVEDGDPWPTADCNYGEPVAAGAEVFSGASVVGVAQSPGDSEHSDAAADHGGDGSSAQGQEGEGSGGDDRGVQSSKANVGRGEGSEAGHQEHPDEATLSGGDGSGVGNQQELDAAISEADSDGSTHQGAKRRRVDDKHTHSVVRSPTDKEHPAHLAQGSASSVSTCPGSLGVPKDTHKPPSGPTSVIDIDDDANSEFDSEIEEALRLSLRDAAAVHAHDEAEAATAAAREQSAADLDEALHASCQEAQAHLAALISMGIEQKAAESALRASGYNLTAALERLFSE
jgi:hypothetical protein